ncbi:MAG: helix-turn-helix domain-containing protein [Parcubacteria group bacterium]|nr:helix-turn-helix domain-containing protein [Parcubacteria group bacterium]
MSGFAVRKIPKKQSVGEKLRDLREANFYTTARFAKRLLIHEKYIKAIESGRYDDLPDEMSTKNFIRSYAKYFGHDPVPYINQYLRETKDRFIPKRKKHELIGRTIPKVSKFWVLTNLTRNIFISFLVLGFVFYIGFEIKKIITPPNLTIVTPQDELVVKKPIIRVTGKTEKEVRVKINGEIVMPHTDGSFNEEVDLQRGLNLIKISAAKKYSKENIIFRKVFFEEAIALK